MTHFYCYYAQNSTSAGAVRQALLKLTAHGRPLGGFLAADGEGREGAKGKDQGRKEGDRKGKGIKDPFKKLPICTVSENYDQWVKRTMSGY